MTASAPATLEQVLAVLRARRDEVRERYRVELYGVVGSLARGQARPDSDVDVFAQYLNGATLFTVGRAMGLIEDDVGREVQLIDSKMLKADMRARMEADLVTL